MEPLSKAKVKHFASLNLKKFRETHQQYLIEGKKMVAEAIRAGIPPVAIVIRKEEQFDFPENIPVFTTSPSDFERISGQKSPEGVLAVLPMPQIKPAPDWRKPAILLWKLQDPGNLGTIIRTADWFGIQQIICSMDTADYLNPKVLRASMGSVFRVKICYDPSLETHIQSHSERILAADLQGENIRKADLSQADFLLIGNEANGLPAEITEIPGINRVKIVGQGQTESLNAAVSAAILCYAWKG